MRDIAESWAPRLLDYRQLVGDHGRAQVPEEH